MEIKNEKVILRDLIESDIENYIRWETVETEWQQWDAPWEYDEGLIFDEEKFRQECLEKLAKKKDDNEIRYRLQVCINDDTRKHIGWCSAYCIDDNYLYTKGEGHLTIGINIPDLASRRKGYATAAWDLFIQYFLSKGIKEFYTQTWSGNYRIIGLMNKLGFEECHRKKHIRKVRGSIYDALTFKLNMDKYLDFRNKYWK